MAKRASESPTADPLVAIVGIGASAGGLEALTLLVENLPAAGGLAYVIIQHLDPHRDSLLAEILRHSATMPVVQVADSMELAANCIHVSPPNVDISVLHGVLHVMPRGAGPHRPIDSFFQSLADDAGPRAIGVVLSGTASDGAAGITAIKAAGGWTFAQDIETSRFQGMPRNAIATGDVDLVLPPDQIALEVVRRAHQPGVMGARSSSKTDLRRDEIGKILLLVRRCTGVDYTGYKANTILRRIERRIMLHRIESLSHYVQYLQQRPLEIQALHEDFLVGATSFFRPPDVFEVLKSRVFPRLLGERTGGRPIRIWVPGCSTGEEVYSLCMALWEAAEGPPGPIQLFATDLNERSLEHARQACYTESAIAHISTERYQQFFSRSTDGWVVQRALREVCTFARHDVTRDPPFSKIDLICCRNLLIYLESDLQDKVLASFQFALKGGGFLILGQTESVGRRNDSFEPLDRRCRVYFCPPGVDQPLPQGMTVSAHIPDPVAGLPVTYQSVLTEARQAAERLLMVRYAPAFILVNRERTIEHYGGPIETYIDRNTGEGRDGIVARVQTALCDVLSEAVNEAAAGSLPVRLDRVTIRGVHGPRKVNLEVIPVALHNSASPYFLIVFLKAARGRRRAQSAADENVLTSIRKSELEQMRFDMMALIETRESANQSLLRTNEALQSALEELQSTKEELVTTREEMMSIHQRLRMHQEEMLHRHGDLMRLNSGQSRLINNLNLPIIILDRHLCIRRYTAMADRIANLIPGDVGRPLQDIQVKLDVPNLTQLITTAIDTGRHCEVHVTGHDGQSHRLRLCPYRLSSEGQTAAALLLF